MEEVKLIWKVIPGERQLASTKIYEWITKCTSYKVYRLERIDNLKKIKPDFGACVCLKDGSYWSIEADRLGPGYPRYYPSLGEALDVVEQHFKQTYFKDQVNPLYKNNRQALLLFAASLAE